MTKDKSIFIKNIYYMLSYAFQVLRQENYEEVAAEEFDHVQDLFAAILVKGVSKQIKQGLYREYIEKKDVLPVLRGKIDMNGTIGLKLARERKIACEFDELSENNLLNQIVKTTMHYLIRNEGVSAKRKALLKQELVFFGDIDTLSVVEIPWSMVRYHRNSATYELLVNICYFVLEGMLQTTESGEYRMMGFSDEQMAKLYEKFILEYYRQSDLGLDDVRAGEVKWNLIGEHDKKDLQYLPSMQTDIMLKRHNRTLIIDAKYYGETMKSYYDSAGLVSSNLYQIFTYVKNYDKDLTGDVSGLLLYAKTDEEITPDSEYNIGGNMIIAGTLDLNQEFSGIANQLNSIVEEHLCLDNS